MLEIFIFIFIYAQKEVFNIKMSSRRGWKTPFAGPSNSTQKGKGIGPYYGQPSGDSHAGNTNTRVDQLTHDLGNMSGYYNQDGDRMVSRNKFKNQAGNNAVKQWGTRGSTTNAPGQPNVVQKWSISINSAAGKPKGLVWQTQTANAKRTNGSGEVDDQRYNIGFDAPPTVVAPPLQHGRQWGGRGSPAHVNLGQRSGEDFGCNVGGWQNRSDIGEYDSINSAPGKPKGLVWQTQTANAERTNGSGEVNDQQYNIGFDTPPTVVAPPLQHGRQWGGRGGPAHVNLGQHSGEDFGCNVGGRQNRSDIGEYDDDYLEEDDDDDELTSNDFDKQFKCLVNELDKLTVEQLNDLSREWRCPACDPGPGANDWYKGLQALMKHAKTTVVRRVKLHRKLAELLGEELNQRGTSVIPIVGASGKWCGLHEAVFDREIVWPPMVVVMNTQLEKDDHGEKWLGMGNQELLDYFRSYEAVKARHSYGPEGHRGMSLLIFESSAMGYLEADRLDNHFAVQGIHRSDWGKKARILPGGTRQLYGYIACRADLDYFNKHTQGKAIVKYNMRSYQEMVVVPLKQMNEDNQQLINFKNKYFEEQKRIEVLKKSVALFSQRLNKTIEENRIVRERTQKPQEQNHKAIDILEGLFKEYTNQFPEVLEQKEREDSEAQSLEEREKVKQSNAYSGTWEDAELRKERT